MLHSHSAETCRSLAGGETSRSGVVRFPTGWEVIQLVCTRRGAYEASKIMAFKLRHHAWFGTIRVDSATLNTVTSCGEDPV